MRCKVTATAYFAKQAKGIAKKYPGFKAELAALMEKLAENPRAGTSLGSGLFKLRMAKPGSGKSGGFRVVTYLFEENELYMITVYDKSDTENIIKSGLLELLKEIDP